MVLASVHTPLMPKSRHGKRQTREWQVWAVGQSCGGLTTNSKFIQDTIIGKTGNPGPRKTVWLASKSQPSRGSAEIARKWYVLAVWKKLITNALNAGRRMLSWEQITNKIKTPDNNNSKRDKRSHVFFVRIQMLSSQGSAQNAGRQYVMTVSLSATTFVQVVKRRKHSEK